MWSGPTKKAVLLLDSMVQKPYDRLMWLLEQWSSPPQILRDAKGFELLAQTVMTATIPFFGSPFLAGVVFLAYVLNLPGQLAHWRIRNRDAKGGYGPALADSYARTALVNREAKPVSRVSMLAFGCGAIVALVLVLSGRSTMTVYMLLQIAAAFLMVVALVSEMYLESAASLPPSSRKSVLRSELKQ